LCNHEGGGCDVCECQDDDVPAFWKKTKELSQPAGMHFQSQNIIQDDTEIKNDLQWCVADFDENGS
jgi:hypothetical protein